MEIQSAFLIVLQNGDTKGTFPVTSDRVARIGRSSENDVVLSDDRCSRLHAVLRYSHEGNWVLEDLGSRNGTLVDDAPVIGPKILVPDSLIKIGHSVLRFCIGKVDTTNIHSKGTGVFGVSGDFGATPAHDDFDPSTIVHHRNKTSFLKDHEDEGDTAENRVTKYGHGAADLCRLAFSLGKAVEIDQVARKSLEGLLRATEGSGAGLWLFPYNEKGVHTASDLRLIDHVTNTEENYLPISESLAKAVFERKEAVLVNESLKGMFVAQVDEDKTSSPWEGGRINNTLAAPIRDGQSILGLIHLYTTLNNRNLELDDLEYTLAVADTVAVALGQLTRQKELAANLNQAQRENTTLRELLQIDTEIIGASSSMQKIHHLISRAAEGRATLLIRGESGTGKELIAKGVHLASSRKSKPLICINCAAIAESLLESELFGHEKGSFTGAVERKQGKFEVAHTGTIFLDEIGEMPSSLQSKLLRVLEGHPFERVGGNSPITVDVRVIAATNRNLENEVAAGRFRHDLFFRLRVLEIVIPPLRKRKEDIPTLANYFLEKFSKETGRKYEGFSTEALNTLVQHRWPGNVRELKNVIERAVVLSSPPWIQVQDLLLSTLSTTGETGIQKSDSTPVFIPVTLEEAEKLHIKKTLEYTGWNKSLAAKRLGIERTTLDRKIKRYELKESERN
ncbi:MAG: sigma 54-interacting transcriptional regulator [Thermoguttaceae bacterium]